MVLIPISTSIVSPVCSLLVQGMRAKVITWRKLILNNEELRDSHSSSNVLRVMKSRIMKWERRVACEGENRNIYRVLGDTMYERGNLKDFRSKWKGTIIIYIKEIWLESVNWIDLAQNRNIRRIFVKVAMTLGGSIIFREFRDQLKNYKLLKKGSAPRSYSTYHGRLLHCVLNPYPANVENMMSS